MAEKEEEEGSEWHCCRRNSWSDVWGIWVWLGTGAMQAWDNERQDRKEKLGGWRRTLWAWAGVGRAGSSDKEEDLG